MQLSEKESQHLSPLQKIKKLEANIKQKIKREKQVIKETDSAVAQLLANPGSTPQHKIDSTVDLWKSTKKEMIQKHELFESSLKSLRMHEESKAKQ